MQTMILSSSFSVGIASSAVFTAQTEGPKAASQTHHLCLMIDHYLESVRLARVEERREAVRVARVDVTSRVEKAFHRVDRDVDLTPS